jgi:glycine oxidase
MATIDVTVMGAGVFGLSVAYACAVRGASVRVIDPNGVASGSSGGLIGALAPHVPENWNDKKAFQFDSLIMADAFWRKVSDLAGTEVGYFRSGRLQPLADERAVELAHARAATAQELWQGKAVWEVEAAGHSAWMPPSASGLVIRDTLSALIHPRRATRALAKAIVAIGGEIVGEGAAVGQTVWATGWSGMQEIGGNGVKGQAALLRYDAIGQPQLFADALHIIPHGDGTVAIGSTSEREFEVPFETCLCGLSDFGRRRSDRALGWCAPAQQKSCAGFGNASDAERRLHRERRVQDRVRHGPEGGRSHGRFAIGRPRYDPQRFSRLASHRGK